MGLTAYAWATLNVLVYMVVVVLVPVVGLLAEVGSNFRAVLFSKSGPYVYFRT
jgi:hypothetical protein